MRSAGRSSGRRKPLVLRNPVTSRCIANMRCGRWELDGGAIANPIGQQQLLKDALQLTYIVDDPRQAAACMEGLAWIAAEKADCRRAAVLMATSASVGNAIGASSVVLPHLLGFHLECQHRVRDGLDAHELDAAQSEGRSFGFEEAVTYALGRPPSSETELSRQVP